MTYGNAAARHGLSLIVFLKWIDYSFLYMIPSCKQYGKDVQMWCKVWNHIDTEFDYYYVFHGRVTLFFANNSLMQCRITVKFLHNFF